MLRWRVRQWWEALLLASLLAIVLFSLSALTDEGGVPFRLRLARILALLPASSTLAFAMLVTRVERRGESLALESLGCSPWGWRAALAFGAMTPAWLGAVALASGLDTSGVFPVATLARPCLVLTEGFLCDAAGLQVPPIGSAELELVQDQASIGAAAHPWLAASVVALTAPALIGLTHQALSRWPFAILAAAAMLVEIALCQAVGAARVPPLVSLLVPGALLLHALLRSPVRDA